MENRRLACTQCHDARMTEYGRIVGETSGQGGGGTAGRGTTDIGASAADFVFNAVDRVAALPPEGLVLLAVIVLASLVVLKRAF